jgi:hypothetical protein
MLFINFSTSFFLESIHLTQKKNRYLLALHGKGLMSDALVMVLVCPDGLLFMKNIRSVLGLINIVIEIW